MILGVVLLEYSVIGTDIADRLKFTGVYMYGMCKYTRWTLNRRAGTIKMCVSPAKISGNKVCACAEINWRQVETLRL